MTTIKASLNPQSILRKLVRLYTIWFPIDKGKGRLIHLLRKHLFIRGENLIERVGSGYLMELDLSDYVQRWIYFFGYYEAPVARWLEKRLSHGMVFCDVGAHVGQYTLLAARAVGVDGKVYAFEPEPRNYARLQTNVGLNKFSNVQLFPWAVGDVCGKRLLYVRLDKNDNWGVHSLHPDENWKSVKPVEVQMVTLDDILHSEKRVDVIKVDVEGAELSVLKGAQKTLEKHDPMILIEAEERNTQRFGYSTVELKKHIVSLGYELYKLQGGSLVPLQRLAVEPHAMLIAFKHRK